MQKGLLLFLTLTFVCASCTKENAESNCERLRDGIISNNADKVKAAINTAIFQLQSKDHTAGNLSSLATILSSRCGASAEVLCFRCIYTNPAQSEIRISFNSGGTTFTKVIDISDSVSNKMVFWNVHD